MYPELYNILEEGLSACKLAIKNIFNMFVSKYKRQTK